MYSEIYLCIQPHIFEHERFDGDKMYRKNNECIDRSISTHTAALLRKLEWSAK